jgi:arylsulfatase A-like enzyme
VPVPSDRTIDGRDVLPVAVSGAKSPHDAVFWAEAGQLAVRRGEWKLVMNGVVWDGTESGSKPLAGEDALFLSNLEEDPGETRNLRHQHPGLVDELATLAHRWRGALDTE